MKVQISNVPAASRVTYPFEVKRVNQPGPHRPNATSPTSAARPVTPTTGSESTGLPAMTEMQVAARDGELALLSTIERLWDNHKQSVSSIRLSQQQKRNNCTELGRHLAELKTIYARPGRKGQWLPFLRKLQMPRSTAEGLINRHLGGGEVKKTSPELTVESITKLLKILKPKLVAVNTRELVDAFVSQLTVVLNDQVAQQGLKTAVAGEPMPPSSPEAARVGTCGSIVIIDGE